MSLLNAIFLISWFYALKVETSTFPYYLLSSNSTILLSDRESSETERMFDIYDSSESLEPLLAADFFSPLTFICTLDSL